MTDVIAALLCLLTSVVALYGVIPWMTRCGSLYLLHNLRDALYDVGGEVAGARDTLIYRDTEYLVTLAIHSVRDLPYRDAVAYLAMYRRSSDRENPRAAQYARELDNVFVGELGAKALNVMREVVRGVPAAMVVRVAFGHPVVLATVIVGLPIVMVRDWIRGRMEGGSVSSPETKLSMTVSIDLSEKSNVGPLRGVRETIYSAPRAFSQIRHDSFGSRELVI
jgi:hypothetical protein